MKLTSSPDAQSLLNITENDSNGNAGKKQRGHCDLSLSHAISASFFENNSRCGEGGSTDWLFKMIKLFLEVIWWNWNRRLRLHTGGTQWMFHIHQKRSSVSWDNIQGYLYNNSHWESLSCLSWTEHSTL